MNTNLTFACGQGAIKAAMTAIEKDVIKPNRCIAVNSTSRDIPEDFTGATIILSSNTDAGCGKVREAARDMMMDYLQNRNHLDDAINAFKPNYVTIITTSEGASGSGSSVALASYITQVLGIPVVIILITGFETDVRGIQNTINYFKDIMSECSDMVSVRVVSNKKFLTEDNTTFDAEIKANYEVAEVLRIIQANDIINSSHNIDDTDHIKLINNSGLMLTSEYILGDNQKVKSDREFIKLINDTIIYNSSIDFKPSASRIGVYLNLNDNNLSSITNNVFTNITEKLCTNGNAGEFFIHKQYDSTKPQYIRIIASGMDYPIDELKVICDAYKSKVTQINTNNSSDTNAMFLNMLEDIGTDDMANTNNNVFSVNKSNANENAKSFFAKSKFVTGKKSKEVANTVAFTSDTAYSNDEVIFQANTSTGSVRVTAEPIEDNNNNSNENKKRENPFVAKKAIRKDYDETK